MTTIKREKRVRTMKKIQMMKRKKTVTITKKAKKKGVISIDL